MRTEKACFKCLRRLPLSEFYPHPMMADGHLNKCKVCARRDSRQDYWRCRNDPAWVAAQRERGRNKYHRLYRPQEPAPFWITDATAEVKRRAHGAFARAVRSGRIVKPAECSACGAEPSPRFLHGHHEDYSKPLDVVWLCTKCHRQRHAQMSPTRKIQGMNGPLEMRGRVA